MVGAVKDASQQFRYTERMEWWIGSIVGLVLLVLLTIAVWKLNRKRQLRGSNLKRIQLAWTHAQNLPSPTLRVIEADTVIDSALTILGYTGALGDKLKKAGPRFSDTNGLWAAHRLRNTLVHALQAEPQPEEVERAMRAFERALKDLGMR